MRNFILPSIFLIIIIMLLSLIVSAKVTGRFTITGEATKNNINQEQEESIFTIIKNFFKKILASPVYGRFEVASTPSAPSEGAGGGGGKADKGVPPAAQKNITPGTPENITNETEKEIPEKKPEIIEIFGNKFLIILLLLIILIIIILILTRKKKKKKKKK